MSYNAYLGQILIVTIVVLILQTKPIHIRNVGIMSCPLGNNPQNLECSMKPVPPHPLPQKLANL